MNRITCHVYLVLLIILSSCGVDGNETEVTSAPASVTFAAFGNTGMDTDDGVVFRELVTGLQNHGVDFAVELGNKLPVGVPPSGAGALLKAVDEEMESISVPVYPVVGANDVFDYFSDVAYSNHYGPMWYSFERGEVFFIVLNTSDESYRSGFGESAMIGEEQIGWLWDNLEDRREDEHVVLFMNSPLWNEAPELWQDRLMPVLKVGDVDLIVSCCREGLYDWGTIDGIRTVSTGCTGPVREKGIGLFPHILLVTMDGERSSFSVLASDGTVTEGIGIDDKKHDMVGEIVTSLTPPVLKTGMSWEINQSLELTLKNPFHDTISGSFGFTTYDNTSWVVDPPELLFSIARGVTKTYNIGIKGKSPDLSPLPVYHLMLQIGDSKAADSGDMLLREIPRPRMGETVSLSARIAKTVPYSFDSKPLRIPVDINGPDTCGRLIIYREDTTDIPVCIHKSPLSNFKDGLNEFTWNGSDIEGRKVDADSLSYYVFVYNKVAPPTWVAEGPPNLYGTFEVERTLNGLIAKTQTDDTLVFYRLAGSVGPPKPELINSFADVLDGLPLTGYVFDSEERIFLTTPKGVVCAFLSGGVVRPDVSFGDRGYVHFLEYRGQSVGCPAMSSGIVYAGVGAGGGNPPALLSIDGETGEIIRVTPLGDFFREESNAPALTATESGVYVAHPDCGYVVYMNHNGEIIWINEPGDMIGDRDTDDRSFTYGIGVDPYGFSYVTTPGYSARCGVLGPDGSALFRVILVILPGLRVCAAVPMIEGKSTDGLYFVTRGGDKPYVFHVPYTVKAGKIINEALVMSR